MRKNRRPQLKFYENQDILLAREPTQSVDSATAQDRRLNDVLGSLLNELRAVDHAIYGVIAKTPTAALDEPMRKLSNAANYSQLWLAIAAVLFVFGGGRARRAALNGVAAIAVTSFLVNIVIKSLPRRTRPDRDAYSVPAERKLPMPGSASFPSGHAASGFAFATAVGDYLPPLAVPLRFLAGAVAYSRVHTGVHYPADAVVGSMIGGAIGHVAASVGRSRLGTRG
jgi:membrane-associated phospholipid phosphatase